MGAKMRIFIAASLAVFIQTMPFEALAYCSKPSEPYCVAKYSGFDDESEFRRCKNDMENYRSEVEAYISCNNDEVGSNNQTAVNEYESAVESFNRRARR
jgi:hypothetical protein